MAGKMMLVIFNIVSIRVAGKSLAGCTPIINELTKQPFRCASYRRPNSITSLVARNEITSVVSQERRRAAGASASLSSLCLGGTRRYAYTRMLENRANFSTARRRGGMRIAKRSKNYGYFDHVIALSRIPTLAVGKFR